MLWRAAADRTRAHISTFVIAVSVTFSSVLQMFFGREARGEWRMVVTRAPRERVAVGVRIEAVPLRVRVIDFDDA